MATDSEQLTHISEEIVFKLIYVINETIWQKKTKSRL